MSPFKKYHLLIWILVFIGIVTVSAMTTFLVVNSGVLNKKQAVADVKQGIILQSELSLTPDQTVSVARINTAYNETTGPVVTAIRDKKNELLDELSKVQADTNKLSEIANDLCTEQKKLQQANIKQFLELKKVCNPEQTQKLSRIYAELYGCSGNGKGEGPGMKHRHRYGQQRQNRLPKD